MLDDIFSLINDWQPQEIEFNLEDSSIDPLDYASHSINNYEEDLTLEFQEPSQLLEAEPLTTFYSSTEYFPYQETWDVSQFDGIGNPMEDSQFWEQQAGSSSCAVVAQMTVYEAITGIELPEAAVCEIAEANGWFDPNSGTSPDAVGKILNAFGISTEVHYDATLNDIADALAEGDKVIVALDANEIWEPMRDGSGNPIEQPNGGHAVWVTGIDQLPDGSVKLILNDSGTPDGQMKVVDAVDFINAWDDFSNHLVVAHNSPQPVIA